MRRYKSKMIRYQSKLNEDVNNNMNDLAVELESTVRNIFPKSYIRAKFSFDIYPSLYLTFALGKDKSEWSMGYMDNDPAITMVRVTSPKGENGITDDGNFEGVLIAEISRGGSFATKPPEGSYYAYGRVKVPFRKTTGDSKKIIEAVKKFFLSLKKSLQDNRDILTDDHIKLIGDKF